LDDTRYLRPFPTLRSSDLGTALGSTAKKFLPVGRTWAMPRVGAPLGPAGTKRPSRARSTLEISSGVCRRAGTRRSHTQRNVGLSDRKSTRLNSSHEWISYA